MTGDDCLHGVFQRQEQLEFSLAVFKRFGYDLERGRLDKTIILSVPNSLQATSGLPPCRRKLLRGCAVLDHA